MINMRNLLSYLAVMVAATIGGASGAFFRKIELPATSISFFRLAIPALVVFVYLKIKKVKLFETGDRLLFYASCLNAVRMLLYISSYLYTSMANAVIILFTWPIWAIIMGVLLLKEKVSKKTILLAFVTFLGIVLMYADKPFSLSNHDFMGMTMALLSSIFFAMMIIIFKKKSTETSGTKMIFHQNFVGAIVFLPFIFLNKPIPTFTQIDIGIIYGLIVGIAVYLLFFFALKNLKVSHYSLLAYWEVPATIFWGWLFFQETISLNTLAGGMVVIMASIILTLDTKKLDSDN